jgi:demethylmenaquinone methyltransferase/2-methoxy-6-polyprenyl-1,4-benzoquinol methylase
MERAGAEDDPFVRAYDWLFERVPGFERFGCRPIRASRTLEEEGFAIERRERLQRARVWPVEVLTARPV